MPLLDAQCQFDEFHLYVLWPAPKLTCIPRGVLLDNIGESKEKKPEWCECGWRVSLLYFLKQIQEV